MDRATKTITTPSKHTVEVYEYATGKDQRAYQAVLYGGLKLKADGNMQLGEQIAPKIEDIPASILLDVDAKLVEIMVVSLDGDKTDVQARIEKLPADDYNFVVGELRGFFRG